MFFRGRMVYCESFLRFMARQPPGETMQTSFFRTTSYAIAVRTCEAHGVETSVQITVVVVTKYSGYPVINLALCWIGSTWCGLSRRIHLRKVRAKTHQLGLTGN